MRALSFQPFWFRIRARGQSSIIASCGTGASWDEIRKGKDVGQRDLCGVEASDNLSESEVVSG